MSINISSSFISFVSTLFSLSASAFTMPHSHFQSLLISLDFKFYKCFLLMKKRSSKRQQYFETIHHQNYSITGNSPLKSPILRENTLTHFRREKPFLQLPKIYPIHNIIKHKRYLETALPDTDASLNLIGTKFLRRMSREKKTHQNQIEQGKAIQKTGPEKQESHKQIFLEEILSYNGIGGIFFQRKEKVKVFIDEGNNSRLINELMRRRVNLKIITSKKDANIVWTQFCDWEQANLGSVFVESQKKIKERALLYTDKTETQSDGRTEEIQVPKTQRVKQIIVNELRMHNHLKNHYEISDKKCLFKNIKKYCKTEKMNQHEIIPKTYHIDENESELPQNLCEKQAIWIVKPGQDTNRGTGISVQQGRNNILKAVRQLGTFGKSSLVQEYIDPLLYKNRKFDIRCYALVTSYYGNLKAYWYKEGYLRTCCKQFNYDPNNVYGHLTNDAIQKKHKDYGKYQPCNKLSFGDLEAFLKSKEVSYDHVLARMKQLALISIKSAEDKLRGDKNMFCFQIFGYDFLIDSKGKVWLIQINTNPCLEFSGSLLSRVIWHMVENSLAIAIDPFLMNLPQGYNSWRDKMDKIYEGNKFQCII